MEPNEMDDFWDGCPLTGRDPAMVVENVEAFMELEGMTEDQAVEATLDSFPGVHGGKDTLRKLLAHQDAHLSQMQPS